MIALRLGASSRWDAIGMLGAPAAFMVFSYYTVIAGWVLAYTWKTASGLISEAGPQGVGALWQEFLADPAKLGLWHLTFVVLVAVISSRGLNRGIEVTNRIRAPALLLLLCILAAYAMVSGELRRGLLFAFRPDFSALSARVVLAAIGQAFYATGVGQAMMIAYGAYMTSQTSLLRTSCVVSGSILLVSLLATLMVFPLVFRYGMDPAQGPQLVFELLPRAFAEMPAGRLVGTLFFLLLLLAALVPSIALLEPTVAWLIQRRGLCRERAVWWAAATAWVLGPGSGLSLNVAAGWYPLRLIPGFESKTFFDVMDYTSSDILLPIGAFLTSVFMGWRAREVFAQELAESSHFTRFVCIGLLRYACPLAIAGVFIATLL